MAGDCFMEIQADKPGDMKGESTDSEHKGWIEIHSYSFSTSQAVGTASSTGGGRSGERCDLSDLSFTKDLDATSTLLFRRCCQGEHLKKVTIKLYKATGGKDGGKQLYMEYILHNSLVTSYSPSGGAGIPMESVTLNPGKIELKYTQTSQADGKKGGVIPAWWDTLTNKGG